MYCRYCGTQLADGTAFCIKCGKKTVKLRPRASQPELAVQQPDKPLQLWVKKLSALAKTHLPKATASAAGFGRAVKARAAKLFAFTNGFDTVMWTVCGVFLGLELVALLEIFASVTQSRLLFPFLQDTPTVLLIAWFVCLVIAQVTHICGYNYRISDEYQDALKLAEPTRPAESIAIEVDPSSLAQAAPVEDAQAEPGEAAEPVVQEEKYRISDEAADIIAELEKLSLTL